jgi:hypothetical protein
MKIALDQIKNMDQRAYLIERIVPNGGLRGLIDKYSHEYKQTDLRWKLVTISNLAMALGITPRAVYNRLATHHSSPDSAAVDAMHEQWEYAAHYFGALDQTQRFAKNDAATAPEPETQSGGEPESNDAAPNS